MRIAIDCFKLNKNSGKSIGIYNLSRNLVKHLSNELECGNYHNENELYIFGNRLNKHDFDSGNSKFIEVNLNSKNRFILLIWELWGVSVYCKKHKIDKVLYPRGFNAVWRPVSDCIIVHDMIPFYYRSNYPKYFNKFENFYITTRLKFSIKSSKQIIAISDATKADIFHYLNINIPNVKVIHNGLNFIEKKPNELSKPYIIAITSGLPHKNAEGIVRGYSNYFYKSSSKIPLLIVGLAEVTQYNIDKEVLKNIRCIRYIENDNELHTLIRNAKLFIFLSLKEGFGFPPIEAQQLGVPVICSNQSSLPEIIGDSGVLVNPYNYDEIGDSINLIVNNDDLHMEYVKRGYRNIERYDWSLSANKYWKYLTE